MAIGSTPPSFARALRILDPRYLYRKLLPTEEAIDDFLTNITTSDWNEEQDAGRPLAEATALLVAQHPDKRELIEAFYGRWEEMLGGTIDGTVDILKTLKEGKQYQLFALTNWSAETWPVATARFECLSWFEGVLVSGEEKMRKPAEAFYRLLEERFPLQFETSIFIDDNARNVAAANALGLHSLLFINLEQLRDDLQTLGVQL